MPLSPFGSELPLSPSGRDDAMRNVMRRLETDVDRLLMRGGSGSPAGVGGGGGNGGGGSKYRTGCALAAAINAGASGPVTVPGEPANVTARWRGYYDLPNGVGCSCAYDELADKWEILIPYDGC